MLKCVDHVEQETRVQTFGLALLNAVQAETLEKSKKDSWIDRLFYKLISDNQFRVQMLRFIDVLPTLKKDADLIQHLQDYFKDDEFPLPALLKWGLNRTHRAVSSHLVAPTVRHAIQILSKRFLVSDDLKNILQLRDDLQRSGAQVSFDLLGEVAVSEAEADDYLATYLHFIEHLASNTETQRDANLSIKPSSLYSQLSPVAYEASVTGLSDRLRPLLRAAMHYHVTIMLDMEHYAVKNIILDTFMSVLTEHEFIGIKHVGIAIQAYLKETPKDIETLLDWVEHRQTSVIVRLVRGAYWDFETVLARQQGWPLPVWASKAETDVCYEHCLARLFAASDAVYTAVGTHNLRSVAVAQALAKQYGLSQKKFEYQMLFGMAEPLRTALLKSGYPVRVYVPFGQLLPGMSYLVRRLLENSSSQSILRLLQTADVQDILLPPSDAACDQVGSVELVESVFRNCPKAQFMSLQERVNFRQALDSVGALLGQVYPLMVGGEEIHSEYSFISYNPSRPKQVVGRFHAASEGVVEQAVNVARFALQAWREWGMYKRAEICLRAAELLQARRFEFAALEVYEVGKTWQEADADVAEAIDFLVYYAHSARRFEAPICHHLPGETNTSHYESLGVCAVISPWNFPLALMVGMVSAALVTGNTVVLKPSSDAATCAAWFVDLLAEAGVPNGVISALPGPGEKVGLQLVCHPKVKFIAFTGSLNVGREIIQKAAQPEIYQHHFKRVIAEMGGKNAIIVDADADIDEAVVAIVQSAFGFQGQKCSACSRVIVVGDIYETLCTRLVAATQSLLVGSPEQPEHQVGPVINQRALHKIQAIIAAGKEEATVALEVVGPQHQGHYVGPVIFKDVSPKSVLAQQEIFGPVLSLIPVESFEMAIEVANNTIYGLTGGLFSRNPSHIKLAKHKMAVGNLYVNRGITGARVGVQEFGGLKLSSLGLKAGGQDYLLQFLRLRTVTENTLRRGFAPESN